MAGRQIGFARVITDHVVFAYVMDVFVDETCRGRGYASEMMNFILSDDELKAVKKWMLATQDACGLYRKFGFEEVSHPERLMERIKD